LLEAKNGGTLGLQGTWNNLGAFTSNGDTGTVRFMGTLNNSGTLNLNTATGTLHLEGKIVGGRIAQTDGATLHLGTGAWLQAVTAEDDLDLTHTSGGTLNVSDGLTLDEANIHVGQTDGNRYGLLHFVDSSGIP